MREFERVKWLKDWYPKPKLVFCDGREHFFKPGFCLDSDYSKASRYIVRPVYSWLKYLGHVGD